MSIPPPTATPSRPHAGGAGVPGERVPETTLELDSGRGRSRRGVLRLRRSELTLLQPGVLTQPLVLAGLVEVAAVDAGRAGRSRDDARFPVLRRIGPSRVLPADERIEGWAWTARGGGALPLLGEAGEPPNVALAFVRPLAPEELVGCFEPEWVRLLAARSPLGKPSVPGLMLVAADPRAAEEAFRRAGLLGPLTDREIPPSMRRHMPGDRAAGVRSEPAGSRTAKSVAPPGMA